MKNFPGSILRQILILQEILNSFFYSRGTDVLYCFGTNNDLLLCTDLEIDPLKYHFLDESQLGIVKFIS